MNIRSQYLLSVTAVLASVAVFAASQDEFNCAYLNEVCWKNTVVDDGIGNKDSDWVELYNPRSFSVNVGGYAIGKKGSWAESEAEGKLFVLPSYTMAPGSYLLVFFNTDYIASETGLDSANGIIRSNAFSLGTNGDETEQDGVRLFVPTEHTRVTNFKNVPILPENTSYGWVYDGSFVSPGVQNTALATFAEPTPGASNRSKGTPTDPVIETGLVINEVCYANLTTPDGLGSTTSDFVELYNPGPGSVSLKGMKLGKKSTLEKCGTAVFELPDYTLESNEYFVVFFNKDVAPASTTVMRTVNGREKSVPLIRSNALSFGTGTSTEVAGYEGQTVAVQDSVRLFDANGERIDNFKGEEVAVATGVRRNSSGLLEALLEDDTAVGYRVDGDGELAVIYTPTPWVSNAGGLLRPAEVVINEVCWSCLSPSEGLTNDFVELYNPGPQSVNIGGMRIGLKSTLAKCIDDGECFTLPDYEMESNEFFVVYFTKNDTVINSTVKRMVNGREKTVPLIRTNVFSLGTDTSDEVPGYEGRSVKVQVSVRLFDKNGERVSNYKGEDLAGTLGVSTDKYGELRATLDDDQTFGYLWDGNLLPNGAKPTASQSGKFVLSKLTPWGPNADGFDLAAPVCTGSLPGRYAAKTACAFTAPEDGAIRYTTDGSDPRTSPTAVDCASGAPVAILPASAVTEASGGELTNAWIRTSPAELATKEPNAEWRKPIGSVSRARVVRAVVTFGPAFSREFVGSWYVGSEFTRGTLPIVSVFADHDHLFSDAKGIYVPGDVYRRNGYGSNKWGKPNANYYGDGEVKAHVELVEPGATAEGLAIDAGLALNGGGTRSLPQKALYVKMKSAYGDKSFTYDLIPSVGEHTYRRFLLRPNGNDWYGPYTDGVSTMMKDAVFHRIVSGLDMFTMAYRPSVVYLNGSYWGIHNIRESVDKQSFSTRYGLNEDELDILTHEDAGSSDVAISVIDGSETAPADYRSWLSSIQSHDVSSAANYNQYVAAKMDVTNYIDYIIAECFFANTDWPINNCDFWRSSTDQTATAGKYGDRRWRWALYDLDLAGLVVDGAGGVNRNMLTYLTSGKMKDLNEPAFLFNQLLKNAAFKDAFVRRFASLLNTMFHPGRTSAIIAAASDEIEDEIETHYRRWGREFTREDWRQAVADALVDYTAKRWANSFDHLASQFPSQLGGAGDLTVKAGTYGRGGSFVVDGNPVELASGEWSGRFFERISVTVRAVPDEGYLFDGWEDDPTAGAERTVSVVSGAPLGLTARFVRDWSEALAVGRHCSLDLVGDLGIVIPEDVDYAAGDKVTVKVEGMAKGLKLVTTQHKEATGRKAVTNVSYRIEGVPTESVDFDTQAMYARVTVTYKDKTKGDKGKVETLQPIEISIVPAKVRTLTAGFLNEVYEPADIAELWPEVKDAKVNPTEWSFKGWPTGIKYNSKATDVNWSYKSPDGKSYGAIAVPYAVYGQPTKAGEFPITATWKHKLEDNKTTVSETFSAVLTVWGDVEDEDEFRYTDQAYVATATKALDATWKSFSGLPTGIKYTTKLIAADTKKGTPEYPAYSLYGTPTKPGVFVVTATKVDPDDARKTVKETFLWKVKAGENDGFLGTMDWDVVDSAVTVMSGVIQPDWTCTLPADAKVTASGLPTGLKLAQDKTTKAWTLSGTPTKAGNYVVVFKTVRNGVTVTERISVIVTPNSWTGSWYGVQPVGDAYASLLGEVTVSANGTVKLVYSEGVSNNVTKTTVTVKNLDANGTTATLTLPKDKKDPASVDRTCVLDFVNGRLTVDGAMTMHLGEVDTGWVAYDVTTVVLEEIDGSETNAYGYVTATYKSGKFTFSGKLWDGTAVKGTSCPVSIVGIEDSFSPVMITDKAKNSVSITLTPVGETLYAMVLVNGEKLSIGRSGTIPWSAGFPAADLKSKKFNVTHDARSKPEIGMTTAETLVVVKGDGSELVLPIPEKSLTAAVSAQGLVKFTLTDEDGWKWTCELLPVDNDGVLQFRGIATGAKTKEPTQYCPVRAE